MATTEHSGLLDERTVVPYLADRLGIDPGTARARALGGGVSNIVLAVADAHRSVVLKQALPRLRVADEWTAPPERALAEADALTLAAALVPGSVPAVLDRDPERYTLVVAHAPDGWRDWKARLLAGVAEPDVAARVGNVLGRWHRETRHGRGLPESLRGSASFDQLRIDPYYRTAARRVPALAGRLLEHAAALAERRHCLVHGDLSPKNVLVAPDAHGLLVIDFEVAHLGDPVFDQAFLLSHLALKAIHRPGQAAAYHRCASAFVDSYGTADWPYLLGHVGCLLVARVHGKSPAEYLTAEQRDRAMRLGTRLLDRPQGTLAALFPDAP